ncbi:phosphoribosylglycinamide synthetase C domain-containing protein, partial [Hydrogenovibrio marinus]
LNSDVIKNAADIKVFHAGTTTNENGDVVTAGGRVLCVTALGENVTEAQKRAYIGLNQIQWDDVYYRTDIGHRAISRESIS